MSPLVELKARLTPAFVNSLPAETRREVLDLLEQRRSLAVRRSLIEWCRHCGFVPAAHHRLLISELEKVARGETPRLAIFMPPGSAKSTYASVLFPPWLLASANWSILAASHTTELAEKWGRRIRNLVSEHSATLGISLAADSQAAGRWSLDSGAEYYAAGVGTGIAGFRAKLGLIDDPIRSRQDADSELIRDRIWDWYINDFKTRLVPHAAEILIQTRWREDDLAGRALNHEEWRVISLPALAEPDDPMGRALGEPLWSDDDYGYGEQLVELSTKTPAPTWSALYQQRPAPEEGDYFKAEWLRPYEKAPPLQTLKVYGASDYAVTATAATTPCISSLALIPNGECMFSTCGGCRRRRIGGSRRSATLFSNGSRSAGRKSRGRSGRALGRSSIGGCASDTPMSPGRSSRLAATRRSGHSRSGAEWSLMDCTCRCGRPGTRISAPNFSASRRASMTIRWMPSASSVKYSTKCNRERHRQSRPSRSAAPMK